MSRKISQETFDEAVNENIEDFGMSREDAIRESTSQFLNQGVDLSFVDTSGGSERKEILNNIIAFIDTIKRKEATENLANNEKFMSIYFYLRSVICTANPMLMRNINMLYTEGGFKSLLSLLSFFEDDQKICETLIFIKFICKNDVLCRDAFETSDGCRLVCHLISTTLSTSKNLNVLLAAIRLCKEVARSEGNKTILMKNGIGVHITKIMNILNQEQPNHYLNIRDYLAAITTGLGSQNEIENASIDTWLAILKETSLLIRELSVHDDERMEMSCAYDNGRYFIGANIVPSLMYLSKQFLETPDLAAAALSATRQLIMTDEAVQVVASHGGMDLPRAILSMMDTPLLLVRAVTGLMRNLCADDARKTKLVNDGTLTMLIAKLSNNDSYSSDAKLVEHLFACLAAMSLRSPTNAYRIIDLGSVDIMIKCMRLHHTKDLVLRQACLAVRNIAARSPELRTRLLDAGIESVLREAGKRSAAVDEAYAALRDLGCDVKYVAVNVENGMIESVFQTFGTTKAKFNPIYDEADDIVDRVQNEAMAPFAANDSIIH